MMKKLFLLLLLSGSSAVFSQEICDNGIDDDMDGLIDIQDTVDCKCNFIANSGGSTTISSLIPNPSFENRSCCPSSYSQLNCANVWIQASSATSDYFNTCGFIGYAPTYGQNPPLPLPNGNGYVGFIDNGSSYKEYVGACLSDTMHAGTNYTIQFNMAYSSGNLTYPISIFGSSSCLNLPFTTSGCPSSGSTNWMLLDSLIVTLSTTSWSTITLSFTPTVDITSIILGPPCSFVGSTGTGSSGYNIYYLDNLILNNSAAFNTPVSRIRDTGHYCTNNLQLIATYDSIPTHIQWYKNGIALINDTFSIYNVPKGGIGDYQVRMHYDSGCVLTPIHTVDTSVITFSLDSLGTCESQVNSGRISVLGINGGTLPYTYSLNNGVPISTPMFNTLDSGIYKVTVIDSNGCSAEHYSQVDIYPKPVPYFDSDSVCFGSNSLLTDSSTIASGSIQTRNWIQNGTVISNTTNLSKVFSNFGNQSITLETISDKLCKQSFTKNVYVHEKPIVNFLLNDTCSNNLVNARNTSVYTTGNLSTLNWNWDFGNGNYSALTSPTINYASAGNFNVKLIGETSAGCKDSATKPVVIYQTPISSFQGDSICEYDSLQLISSNSTFTYKWDLGDGSPTQTTYDVKHKYSTSGNYIVRLIVNNSTLCADTSTQIIKVFEKPVINFSFDTNCAMRSSNFTNLSTISSGINTLLFDWKFGDGGTSSSKNTSHMYSSSGSYSVQLKGTSADGCKDSILSNVVVLPELVLDFISDTICERNETKVANRSTGIIRNLIWNYGDGNSSTSLTDSTHLYASYGNYGVKLKVFSSSYCYDSIYKSVSIKENPLPYFNSNNQCDEDSVRYNNSTNSVAHNISTFNWSWKFGDGITSSVAQPKHLFATHGSYLTTLYSYSPNGCFDSISRLIYVHPLPIADFDNDSICLGETITFNDQSIVPYTVINEHNWSLDSFSSNTTSFDFVFSTPGFFPVMLKIKTDSGCVDSITKIVQVFDVPVANFDFNQKEIYLYDPKVCFINSSIKHNYSYWNFDFLGGNSTQESPCFVNFPNDSARSYLVKLKVSNQFGCEDSITRTVKILPNYHFYIPNSFTPNNDGINDKLIFAVEGSEEIDVRIFNRWGEQIFATKNKNEFWDGSFKSSPVQNGVYVYRIKVKFDNNEIREYFGHVSIIK